MCTPRSKRNRLLLVLLLLVAAVAGWWFVTPHERVYRGQPVSEWVRQLSITSLGETNAILDVLLDIGPDCLPPLVANLESQDNVFSKAGQKYWRKLPRGVRNALPRPIPRVERRATAAWALGQIGPAARPVTAALVAALDDPENRVRAEAAQALRYVNPRASGAIAALARRLSDPAPMVRSRAAEALWDMAPESQAALPALIQLLNDPVHAYEGALCMQELGPLASNAVPDLIDVVKQGVAGHPPKQKFSSLHSDQEDPRAHARAIAAKALGKIGIANAQVLDTLQDALKYPPTLEGAPGRLCDPGSAKMPHRRWV